MGNRFIWITLLAISLCVVAFVPQQHKNTFFGSTLPYIHNQEVDYHAAREYWKRLIINVGPTAAYEELIHVGSTLSVIQGHFLAHTFGEALFAEEGVHGLYVCDDQLLWGCYHQFVGQAIATLGIASAKDLNAACVSGRETDQPFDCQHGIGHGILGYYGYTADALRQALKICDSLQPHSPLNGCVDGVFMEYNFHELTFDEPGSRVRQFLPSNPYSPCFDLAERYRLACIRELPLWWYESNLGISDLPAIYHRYGEYCRALGTEDFSRVCFHGIGYAVGSESDSPKAEQACTAAAENDLDLLSCLSSAARRLHLPDSSTACKQFGLSGTYLSYCKAYAETRDASHLDMIPFPRG